MKDVSSPRRGGRLILACRSGIPEAGEQIRRLSGSDTVEMLHVDLADLHSVRRLGDRLAERAERLDVVIANAGVMPRRSRRTVQGFELMFGVNYLGHAMLLRRLLSLYFEYLDDEKRNKGSNNNRLLSSFYPLRLQFDQVQTFQHATRLLPLQDGNFIIAGRRMIKSGPHPTLVRLQPVVICH